MVVFDTCLQNFLGFLHRSSAQIQYEPPEDDDLLEEVAMIAGCLDDDVPMIMYDNLLNCDSDYVLQLNLNHFPWLIFAQ